LIPRFLAPRYWPLWLGLGLVRALLVFPFAAQMAVGRGLGRLAHVFARRDRRIADVNLRLCFPALDATQRRELIRRHFESLGCALIETALVWWAEDEKLRPLLRIEGEENLAAALAGGRGAILLSAHFTTLEIGARAATMTAPTAIMYQEPKNALIGELSRRGRARRAARAIASDSVRELLQSLKQNLAAWYAPDQRDLGKSGALVPFFGVPAATNVATSRLARISGAPVLPYFPQRLPGGGGYVMRIGKPLEGFPSDDPVADATRFHALIEEHVRRCPDQYLWTYKRFKRPGPDGDPYSAQAASARGP
jgi:KDO2-lipid IV(A) lauroyltransferase